MLSLQVPLPERPDTEDEALLKKWKWKVKSVKKENRERHSQRCDTELKLAVRSIELHVRQYHFNFHVGLMPTFLIGFR